MFTAIAIDGPAGAGKSTISKEVAKKLGYIYVDTGALYRTVALAAKRNGVTPDETDKLKVLLDSIVVELAFDETKTQIVMLNGEDVSSLIRTPEISMLASSISAVPMVRAYLLDLQRNMAKKHNVIMDGRDIGTVVLPDAQVKIFLTASPQVRAKRRYDELILKGENVCFDEVLKDVITRDYNDSHREIAPLKPAKDSVLADTSEMDFQKSVELIISIIEENK